MNQPAPLPVAVLIAAHNRADWVAEAVESALGQEPFPPAEVIVIDDASTDDTAEVARAAGATVLRHDINRGAAAARNTGAAATTQPWIAPLDSDDRWLPDALATLWPLRGEFGFVGGASIGVDEMGRRLYYGGVLAKEPFVLDTPAPLVFPENFVAASGVIVRRETFQAAGGYRQGRRNAEDFDLWLRLLAVRPGICIPRVVTLYRIHDGQKSQAGQSSRQAVLDIVDSYRDEPWCTEELRDSHRVVMEWDSLREARPQLQAARTAWWIARRRSRRRALYRTVARRRAGRRRALGPEAPPGATTDHSARVSADS